ncbi:transglutaminase-like domain-containing protein [Methyloterricola oryzae]|uniref:transglutaminase-like domain-containing protein n=1 Tax=Methyloterricola oryzae TaxID=1495050 RepID=UPI0005EB007F|nr:transglutaminase-like domain-containing protein [Methyloterricola oryzae]
MDRRSFLKHGLAATSGIVLTGLPRLNCLASTKQEPWRTYEVTVRIDILDPSGAVRAWVPLPLMRETGYFKREPDTCSGNYRSAKVMRYDSFGTGMLFAQWTGSEGAPVLEIKSRFATQDRQLRLDKRPSVAVTETKATLDYFRRPSKLIKTHGIVASTSRRITAPYKQDIDKARAIYDWIIENTFRDPKVKGCGTGDIETMLHTGYLGGKCADLNALYVGLARAAGLPARDVYGIRIANSSEFTSLGRADDITGAQHCRAEVFLTGYGWVPVDPADVRKVVLEENAPNTPLALDDAKVKRARDKLFGSWEMNWVPYNYAHDVRLPEAHGPEMGYFMYPQAETAKGRKDCLDPKSFIYVIRSKEI